LRGQPVIVLDGVIGGIELRELLHFTDQIDRIELLLAGLHVAMNKSAKALGNIADPTGFAVLTIADHIDAGLGLLTDDVCNFLAQKLGEDSVIVRKVLLPRGHDLANSGGSHEAPYVGDKDTIRASFHASSPLFVILIWSIAHHLIHT
jgi:hypothetical protein